VQLAGGVGSEGDEYERHADEVAALVVRGESAEALLDRYAGGGGGNSAVQKWNPPGGGRTERERAEIERTQTWDPAMEPVVPGAGAETAEIGAAIAGNRELGFSRAHIAAIRRTLGVAPRPGAFDRALVEAIIAFQRDHAVASATPGVLDEATIFAIDFGALWDGASSAPRHYERTAPWNDLDDARLAVFRTTLAAPLHVVDSDLALSEPRRGHRHAIVTTRFVQQVYNWQFWHHRSGAMATGRLSDADLGELGLAPVAPVAPVAPAAPAAEGPAVEAPIGEAPASEVGPAPSAEVAPAALTPTQLRAIERRLRALIPELPATPEPGAALPASLTQIRDELAAGIPPNDWLAVSYEWTRPRAIANALINAAGIARGRTIAPPRRRTRTPATAEGEAPPAPDGHVPTLERHGVAEARAHLAESGTFVADSTLSPGARGWDARVVGGGAGHVADQADVVRRAEASVTDMGALEARLQGWLTRLDTVLAHTADTGPILEVLTALRTAHASGELRAPTHLPRGAWQPTWPRAIPEAPAHPLQTAREWRRALNRALGEIPARTAHYRTMATRDPRTDFLRGSSSTVPTVDVDLHATGVEVTRAHGGRLSQAEMRIDAQFADALVRFLEDIRGLGVTTMRTNGLLRDPLSFEDTHPRGLAADICGFIIDGQEIHLRNGRENPDGYAGGAGAFSDWYNRAGAIRGQTPSAILHAITARMAQYFSMIVGPGHNAAHDNHWHVQLTTGSVTGGADRADVMVIQDDDVTEAP
jgi:hypothetical protein